MLVLKKVGTCLDMTIDTLDTNRSNDTHISYGF